MNSARKIALTIGVLFIAELVLHAIGSILIEAILDTPDYLLRLAANKNPVITGVLLEAICAVCLLIIGFMMYPILKKYNEMVALGYFGFRVVETVIATIFSISHLAMFALSRQYVKAGAPDASNFQTIGALLKEGHNFTYQIYVIFYSMGCLILFSALFKARPVPRIISILGIGAAVLLLIGLVADLYGSNISMEIYAMPLGLSQVLLAIWLIAKGFNASAVFNKKAKADNLL